MRIQVTMPLIRVISDVRKSKLLHFSRKSHSISGYVIAFKGGVQYNVKRHVFFISVNFHKKKTSSCSSVIKGTGPHKPGFYSHCTQMSHWWQQEGQLAKTAPTH